MNRQRGISFPALAAGIFVLIVAALLGMKVAPSVIEYSKLKSIVKSMAQDGGLKDKSLGELRVAFGKRAEIDEVKSVTAQDLDITKDNGELVIGFAYESRIPLFANVSLVIAYEGSSAK